MVWTFDFLLQILCKTADQIHHSKFSAVFQVNDLIVWSWNGHKSQKHDSKMLAFSVVLLKNVVEICIHLPAEWTEKNVLQYSNYNLPQICEKDCDLACQSSSDECSLCHMPSLLCIDVNCVECSGFFIMHHWNCIFKLLICFFHIKMVVNYELIPRCLCLVLYINIWFLYPNKSAWQGCFL